MIGANLSDALLDGLHLCCLTDDEMESGPDAWTNYEDPFPAWRIAAAEDDEVADGDHGIMSAAGDP